MDQTVTGERPSDIIASASAVGFAVSERQLKRWHFEGLIQKPTQSWPGGIAGSESSYPVGTGNQILALCGIRQKYRRSKDIGWLLWWLGFEVDEKYWKTALVKRAAWLDKYVPKIIAFIQRKNDSDSSYFNVFRKARTRNFLFRQLRKRIGERHFDNFLFFMADVLNGNFEGWNPAAASDDIDLVRDKMMIDKAMGLHRSRNEEQVIRNPQTYDDVEKVFSTLSARLSGARITEVLDSAANDLVVCTRNEVRGLFTLANSLIKSGVQVEQFGVGLGVLAKFTNFDSALTHQSMLLFLLALKEDAVFQKTLNCFVDALRRAALAKVSQDQINEFKNRDPALIEFLCQNAKKIT